MGGFKKMNKSRKVFSFIFAISLGIGSLTACSNESASSKSSKEPSEFSAMVKLHTPEVPDKKVLDILAKETNMKLDIQFVPATTYPEKVNTLFATGSFPDSVVLDLEMLTQYKEAVRDGQSLHGHLRLLDDFGARHGEPLRLSRMPFVSAAALRS